ncbi:MAG: hypothetical protein AAF415_14675 [Pseudomonadota bacterium]
MRTLGRILKLLIVLGVLGAMGLSAYALLFDLPAPERERQIVLPLPDTS